MPLYDSPMSAGIILVRFFMGQAISNAIELPLRRTLVLSHQYAAAPGASAQVDTMIFIYIKYL